MTRKATAAARSGPITSRRPAVGVEGAARRPPPGRSLALAFVTAWSAEVGVRPQGTGAFVCLQPSGGRATRRCRGLDECGREVDGFGSGDGAAGCERAPSVEGQDVTEGGGEELSLSGAGAPAHGQDLGRFGQVALEGNERGREGVDELEIAKDVVEHRLGLLVVGVELVKCSCEPLLTI